ncbi:Hsp70 family protein [Bradyrhizobium oligotrophicum]|uniref:Hsp70 family protein n=1 Tax=Bradyrhizobium oligotrophicum TaxID=44255 RepID=UPI003EBCA36F
MAGQIFGLDFGTTNSLLSVIGRDDRPIFLTDERDRPHPSTIWYRGADVIVGRKSREHLDAGAEAITGSFVRSPKRLLDQDAPIHVGGLDLDPRDVIAEVLRFLRHDAATEQSTRHAVDRAVVTIPVKLDGAGRRRLREAARKAEIGVIQFVHEPLAALYAYLRSRPDYRRQLAELDGCRILVFDWGGGTLDLTLCQVHRGQIVQLANVGDDEVGGDRFDELVRNKVRDRHALQHQIEDIVPLERDEARIMLLNQCELRKIELSEREAATVLVRNYLRREGPSRDLNVTISRAMLADCTRDLVNRGLGNIDALLQQFGLSYHQIALCLATGGMVNMPAIRDGLNERFGARAPRLANGDRIISEGAAWIAHDGLRLGLAKPIELLQSDDTYAAVVPIPFELPIENETKPAAKAVYRCVDPRPGRASFTFARPARPKVRDARSDRLSYATLHLEIDSEAAPLMERLDLEMSIDHDYVAQVSLFSTMREHQVRAEIFDLEFTLRFPTSAESPTVLSDSTAEAKASGAETASIGLPLTSGGVRLRANIAVENSWQSVPGDLVIQYRPNWFEERAGEYSAWQKEEWVYYKDCPYCHRSRYEFRTRGCQDARCLWKRAYAVGRRHEKGSTL